MHRSLKTEQEKDTLQKRQVYLCKKDRSMNLSKDNEQSNK